MYRKLLAATICAALAVPAWAASSDNSLNLSLPDATPTFHGQTTTDQNNKDDQDKHAKKDQGQEAKKLETVTVTGSLLPRSQVETDTPTITITNEDIQRQGFDTVAAALHAMPQATGSVQGSQFSGGFTQGAQTISLLGLPPGFTLFLIDGKPMADYPLLYNGSGNFVDISSIPMAMVDHIDIVPGNQSSIYGSSAIAGVVNIILKKHVEGITLDYRQGMYTMGGGKSERLQLTGGHDWQKASITYSLELQHQKPIYRYQRRWFDSLDDSPTARPGDNRRAFDYLLQDLLVGSSDPGRFFVAGGPSSCKGVSKGFDDTEDYFEDPAGRGGVCGSPNAPAYSSMRNGYKSATGYVNFTYDFTPNAQFYANALYTLRKTNYYVGSNYTWWGSGQDLGVIYAPNVHSGTLGPAGGTYLSTQYTVDTTAAGVGDLPNEKDLNRSYVANVGMKGGFGDSDWTYDAYFHRSDNVITTRQLHFIADKVDHYFLGDQVGVDPLYGVYPAYNLDLDRFYSLMDPETYRSLSGEIRTRSHTYTQELSGVVTNSNLFDLPGGPAGIALLAQYGNQKWDNPTDPRLIDGYFWGLTGTLGGGHRNRYAGAVEMTFPFTSWLTTDASARFDNYKASGRDDHKITYKLGVEIRPTETLLIRADYATAFRAPDLGRLYKGKSGQYFYVVDYYRCRLALGDHFDVNDCPYNNEQSFGYTSGNKDLKNITAKSWGGGIVWSPTTNFNVHADYYSVMIDNEVSNRSLNGIMAKEADCRIGHNVGGSPVDINSPTCQEALDLVVRNNNPANPLDSGLESVSTYPINISNERVRGITAGTKYFWNAGAAGDFVFGLNYNVTLSHTYQQYPGDPTLDELSLAYLGEFKSRTSGQVTWSKSRFSLTLYGNRDGSMANWQNNGRLGPWITYNASANYQATENLKISLVSNNVTNKRPPRDPTDTDYPYYNGFVYNGFGRSVYAELTWDFF